MKSLLDKTTIEDENEACNTMKKHNGKPVILAGRENKYSLLCETVRINFEEGT